MKKLITGAIAGALLLTSVSVFADSASLVGKKVQGLFTVEQNGKRIADAVIIDGTAYAPVRAVSEAAGVELKVEGKKILMLESKSETTVAESSPSPTATPSKTETDIIKEKARNIQIEINKQQTAGMDIYLKLINDKNNTELKEKYEQYDNSIKGLQEELKVLERQLAELQK